MKRSSLRIAVAATVFSAALSACIVAPAPAPVYGDAVAYEAPPAPQYEVVGVAPGPGFFWIGGAWFWEGGRYTWHPGRWERERPGYRWVAHGWEHRGNRWVAHPGHWERR
jgi:WXXGXW repeat (2 copies)